MSFLDLPTVSPEVLKEASKQTELVLGKYFREVCGIEQPPGEYIKAWIDDMVAGKTPAAKLGLSQENIDALLARANDLIIAGSLGKARDVLLFALSLNPMEERAHYAIAATFQLEHRYADAGRSYAFYLWMKPLDPAGYLRMGECLLYDGSLDEAKECIEGAHALAVDLNDSKSMRHAETILEFIKTKVSAIHM